MITIRYLLFFLFACISTRVSSYKAGYDIGNILSRLEQQEKMMISLQEKLEIQDKMTRSQQEKISQLEIKLSQCTQGAGVEKLRPSQRTIADYLNDTAPTTMDSPLDETFRRSLNQRNQGLLLHPQSSENSRCAFMVSPATDITVGENVPIVFSRVFLNENNCYNTGDGIFVASADGIYNSFWKITSYSGKYAGVHFKVNGRISGPDSLVKSEDHGLDHNSVSSFAIARLNKGDHVYLVCDVDNSFIHAGHSGFGGYFVSG